MDSEFDRTVPHLTDSASNEPPIAHEDPPYFSTDDLERRYRRSDRSIRRDWQEGRFPSPTMRVGRAGRIGSPLWRRDVVLDWEREQAERMA